MPETPPRTTQPTFFATPAAFRKWLERHHAARTELLVGFYKRTSGRTSMTWAEAVDEALCFGWIDGVRRSLDGQAYTIRFTPRKASSIWSVVNVENVARLKREGKMHAAGMRAFEARRADRTGVYSFERKQAATFSPEQALRLQARPEASAFFRSQPPWYQRAATHWVISAKREETRERRLAQLIEHCAKGQKIER